MGTTLQELLGARIRICIEKNGYRTVEEFAFAFGIGKSTLSDILTGKKSPTVTTLARWANALKIPLADFFEDERINIWVREAPPEYFHNRRKPSGDPVARKTLKASKGSKVLKVSKVSKVSKALKGARKSAQAPAGPARTARTVKEGPSSPPKTFLHAVPESSAHAGGKAKPGKARRSPKRKTVPAKGRRATVMRVSSGKK